MFDHMVKVKDQSRALRGGATLQGRLEETNTMRSVLLSLKQRKFCDSKSLMSSKHLWLDLKVFEELGQPADRFLNH